MDPGLAAGKLDGPIGYYIYMYIYVYIHTFAPISWKWHSTGTQNSCSAWPPFAEGNRNQTHKGFEGEPRLKMTGSTNHEELANIAEAGRRGPAPRIEQSSSEQHGF